jgi:hypothetical protein
MTYLISERNEVESNGKSFITYSFSTIVAFWMQTFSYVKILHDVLCILKKVDRWKWNYLKNFGKVKSKEMSP